MWQLTRRGLALTDVAHALVVLRPADPEPARQAGDNVSEQAPPDQKGAVGKAAYLAISAAPKRAPPAPPTINPIPPPIPICARERGVNRALASSAKARRAAARETAHPLHAVGSVVAHVTHGQ